MPSPAAVTAFQDAALQTFWPRSKSEMPGPQPQLPAPGASPRCQPQVPAPGASPRCQPQVPAPGASPRCQPQVPVPGSTQRHGSAIAPW
eukprot:356767-Chlamydomonas_euryale.AAC.2